MTRTGSVIAEVEWTARQSLLAEFSQRGVDFADHQSRAL
jgi:DNA phosphorothioation-dependent restriction protein DptG